MDCEAVCFIYFLSFMDYLLDMRYVLCWGCISRIFDGEVGFGLSIRDLVYFIKSFVFFGVLVIVRKFWGFVGFDLKIIDLC